MVKGCKDHTCPEENEKCIQKTAKAHKELKEATRLTRSCDQMFSTQALPSLEKRNPTLRTNRTASTIRILRAPDTAASEAAWLNHPAWW